MSPSATEGGQTAEIVGVWEGHRKNPSDLSLFSDSASLLYVPTAAGGRGLAAVKAFLDRTARVGEDAAAAQPAPRVVRTVVDAGSCSLVEESVFEGTITLGNSAWICPGADLRAVLGKRVGIPLVTVVTFSSGKIEMIRVYWDQASVLAQIGVLSPAVIKNNDLPILTGTEEVELVDNPESGSYNKLAKPDIAEDLSHLGVKADLPPWIKQHPGPENESVDILSQGNQPVQYRLSSRVLQPGGTGGKSSVFSDEPETRRAIPADRRRYETHISFGNASASDQPDLQEQQHRAPSESALNNLSSHFQLGQNGASAAAVEQLVTGKKVHPDKTNLSQITFKEEGQQPPGESSSITGARKRPGSSNQNLLSQIDLGADNTNSPPEQPRPSSRVTRPPGGGSSLTLG